MNHITLRDVVSQPNLSIAGVFSDVVRAHTARKGREGKTICIHQAEVIRGVDAIGNVFLEVKSVKKKIFFISNHY